MIISVSVSGIQLPPSRIRSHVLLKLLDAV